MDTRTLVALVVWTVRAAACAPGGTEPYAAEMFLATLAVADVVGADVATNGTGEAGSTWDGERPDLEPAVRGTV